MSMSPREQILCVYRGGTPDSVPYMLDLSHWFYHRNRMPWDLSQSFEKPEYALIDYHKRAGAVFYMPNLASFYAVDYAPDVQPGVIKSPDGCEITWRYETPLGVIARKRTWSEQTYAWAISEWGIRTEQDLKVLAYALAARTFTPRWDRYRAWESGDCMRVNLAQPRVLDNPSRPQTRATHVLVPLNEGGPGAGEVWVRDGETYYSPFMQCDENIRLTIRETLAKAK